MEAGDPSEDEDAEEDAEEAEGDEVMVWSSMFVNPAQLHMKSHRFASTSQSASLLPEPASDSHPAVPITLPLAPSAPAPEAPSVSPHDAIQVAPEIVMSASAK